MDTQLGERAEGVRTIDGLQLVRLLGTGPFSTVWLANDLDRVAGGDGGPPVAVKMLTDYFVGDPAVRADFLEQVTALRQLAGPHLVPLIRAGEMNDGRAYSAAVWADQGCLRQRLRTSAYSVGQVLATTAAIAKALDALHAQGVVHHRLTPANVLFISDDVGGERTVLADPRPTALLGRSRHAAVSHSPFTAPEQLEMESAVDSRCDIYALGAMILAMATGVSPTGPGTQPQRRTPLRALDVLIARCLSPDPRRRPTTCAELLGALEELRPAEETVNPITTGTGASDSRPREVLLRTARALVPSPAFRSARRAGLSARLGTKGPEQAVVGRMASAGPTVRNPAEGGGQAPEQPSPPMPTAQPGGQQPNTDAVRERYAESPAPIDTGLPGLAAPDLPEQQDSRAAPEATPEPSVESSLPEEARLPTASVEPGSTRVASWRSRRTAPVPTPGVTARALPVMIAAVAVLAVLLATAWITLTVRNRSVTMANLPQAGLSVSVRDSVRKVALPSPNGDVTFDGAVFGEAEAGPETTGRTVFVGSATVSADLPLDELLTREDCQTNEIRDVTTLPPGGTTLSGAVLNARGCSDSASYAVAALRATGSEVVIYVLVRNGDESDLFDVLATLKPIS